MSSGPRQTARKEDSQIPDFERDINTLIDCFYLQVQSGKPCNLTTFKAVWSWLHFSFVHQAIPGNLNAADHLQLLFSAALNRLDTCVPILAGAVAEAWRQSQAQGAWHPGTGSAQGQEQVPAAQTQTTGQGQAPQQRQETQAEQQQETQAEQQQQQEDEGVEHVGEADVDHMQELDELFAFLDQEGAANPEDAQAPEATACPQAEQEHEADAASAGAASANPTASTSGRPAEAAAQQHPASPRIRHHQGRGPPLHQPAAATAAEGQPDAGLHEVEPAGQLPPLAVRIGVIYALYCLYETQIQSPRCNIYLPLVLLDLLTAMVPELQRSQALDALKILQALWRGNAFLVGESRRPPSFLLRSSLHRHSTTNLSISGQLMDNRAVRDALFHMRSDLKSLTDFKQLGQVTGEYARLRERIFKPSGPSPHASASGQEHEHLCPSSPEEDPPTSGRLPPMLFPAGFAQELQQCVEQEGRRVQLSLLPQARPGVQGRAKRKSQAEKAGAGDGVGTAEEAAADPSVPEPFIGGVFGDVLRRTKPRAAMRKPSADPSGDDPDPDGAEDRALLEDGVDLEGAMEGLSGRAAAAMQRQLERRRLCSAVQGMWLSSHTQLMQQEEQREQQRRRDAAGAGAGAGAGAAQEQQQQMPRSDRAAAESGQSPGADAMGDAACVVESCSWRLGGREAGQRSACAAGTGTCAGREVQAAEQEAAAGEVQACGEEAGDRELQAPREQASACEPHDTAGELMEDAEVAAEDADLAAEGADLAAEDADLAAELDMEFGDTDEDAEEQEEQDASRGDGFGGGSNADEGSTRLPTPIDQAQAWACAVVWCNGKPGVFGLAGGYSVRCFCSDCRLVEAPGPGSWEPLAFVRHCGLKGKVWRQSISVDEELQGQVAGRAGDDVHVAALLEGRAAGKKRGAKKLGDWLKEAEQQGGAAPAGAGKGRRGAKKAPPRAAAPPSPRPGPEALGAPAAPAPAPAPAPASRMEVDDEYADILAQFDTFDRVMASVQHITEATNSP